MNMIDIDNKEQSYEYFQVSYEINQVVPLLELKRIEVIRKIEANLKLELINNNINIHIEKYFPKWLMAQISISPLDYKIDPLIPYNADNYEQLVNDILNTSYVSLNRDKVIRIMKNINLKEKCNNGIKLLKEYINSEFYHNYYKSLNAKVENNVNEEYVLFEINFDESYEKNQDYFNIKFKDFK